MATLNIRKVLSLPQAFESNTIYLVKGSAAGVSKIYISDNTGSAISEVDTSDKALAATISVSTTAPDLGTTTSPFWWDPTRAILFIRYTNESQTSWVQASPNVEVPEFAGTGGLFGTADTMARSDHQHDHLVIDGDW